MQKIKAFTRRIWNILELLDILGLGVAGVGLTILHQTSGWVQELSLAWQIVLYISIILLVLYMVRLLTPQFLRQRKPHVEQPTPTEEVIKTEEQGIEFYNDREALGKKRPISKQLESASEIWALWLTGIQAFIVHHAAENPNLKRLLLPHPDSPLLEPLANSFKLPQVQLAVSIRNLTKAALDNNKKVRWFEGMIGDTMMIGNPNSPDGWIQIETLIASVRVDQRPIFRITKRDKPKLFETLVNAYLAVWDDSVKPEDDFRE